MAKNGAARMKVATAMGLSFALVILMSVAIAILARVQLSRTGDEMRLLLDDRLVKMERTNIIRLNLTTQGRAIRDLILSTNDSEKDAAKALIAEVRGETGAMFKKLEESVATEQGRQILKAALEARNTYNATMNKVIELALQDKDEEARAILSAQGLPAQAALMKPLQELVGLQETMMKDAGTRVYDLIATTGWLVLVIAGLAVVVGAAITVLLTRSITRQLGGEPEYASSIAREIAAGDLAVQIDVKAGDRSSLLANMRDMRDSLARVVAQVRTGADTVATASTQISSGNVDLSSRTEEQASSLEQTASSMEELTSTVRQNADNARQANQLVVSTADVAVQGGVVVNQVIETMASIKDSSHKIVDIIGVIDGIAFQTNILALNAAVEAARAGEQGRGFAVVASEVRNLAQRSASAAKEIKSLIEDSVGKVENGSKLVDQAGQTMDEIVGSVKRVTDIVGEIASASAEQSSGIEQVGQAVNQMDKMTQQNAALVEQAAAASASLQAQAARLTEAVSFFRVQGAAGRADQATTPAASTAAAARDAKPARRLAAAGASEWEAYS